MGLHVNSMGRSPGPADTTLSGGLPANDGTDVNEEDRPGAALIAELSCGTEPLILHDYLHISCRNYDVPVLYVKFVCKAKG